MLTTSQPTLQNAAEGVQQLCLARPECDVLDWDRKEVNASIIAHSMKSSTYLWHLY
jgi:hypothetical protein